MYEVLISRPLYGAFTMHFLYCTFKVWSNLLTPSDAACLSAKALIVLFPVASKRSAIHTLLAKQVHPKYVYLTDIFVHANLSSCALY